MDEMEFEHAQVMQRIEAVMRVAESTQNRTRLDELMAKLAEAQKRTEERFSQTDINIDARIDKLVSDIREFLRRKNGEQS